MLALPVKHAVMSHHTAHIDGEDYHLHYKSTACFHDEHEKCRKVCKYCGVACWCPCHSPVQP